jgi:hypothetical protein
VPCRLPPAYSRKISGFPLNLWLQEFFSSIFRLKSESGVRVKFRPHFCLKVFPICSKETPDGEDDGICRIGGGSGYG